jgi:hypothetical protein
MTFDKSRIDSQDRQLLEASARIDKDQAKSGLWGLTGGLDHVIINTQPDGLNNAVTNCWQPPDLSVPRLSKMNQRQPMC